ncbi:CHAT domain-containing protein [Kitasatospora sp. NPDC057500]|uniref:CHAT domain-containing protein n=1 Tax=Kitasatospora sp. NPDC057500 TaxID=3346151 RepID=UPI0036CAF093
MLDHEAWIPTVTQEQKMLRLAVIDFLADQTGDSQGVLLRPEVEQRQAMLLDAWPALRWHPDVRTAQLLGLSLWCRGIGLGDTERLARGVEVLRHVRRFGEELVPAILLPPPEVTDPAEMMRQSRANPLRAFLALTTLAALVGDGLGWGSTPEEVEAVGLLAGLGDGPEAGDEVTAIPALRRSVELLPPDHWWRPWALTALATALVRQGRWAANAADALALAREAAARTGPDHPYRADILYALVNLLRTSWGPAWTVDEDEVAEVLAADDELVRVVADDHPHRLQLIDDLGTAYFLAVRNPGERRWADRYLARGRLSVAQPRDSADEAALAALNFAEHFTTLATDNPGELLEEWQALARAALAAAPAGSALRDAAAVLLADALRVTAERRRDLAPATEAIAICREVLRDGAGPRPGESPEQEQRRRKARTEAQARLARLLALRGTLSGDSQDLGEARGPAPHPPSAPAPPQEPGRPDPDTLLGRLHGALGALGGLDPVVRKLQTAQDTEHLGPAEIAEITARLQRVADDLAPFESLLPGAAEIRSAMAEITGVQRELTAEPGGTPAETMAVEQLRAIGGRLVQALDPLAEHLPQTDTAQRLVRADFLAGAGEQREAEQLYQDLLAGLPPDVPEHAQALHGLAKSRLTRAKATWAAGEPWRSAAADAWQQGLADAERYASHPLAAPAETAGLAALAVTLAEQRADWPACAPLLALVVRGLTGLASQRLSIEDRERLLGRHARTLGADACVAALLAGFQPADALGLLEAGRGLLPTVRLGSLTELEALRRVFPQISARFTEATEELERANRAPDALMRRRGDARTDRKHRAADRWETELAAIRRLPGFARFLEVPDTADLRRLAACGPVVAVSPHHAGTYAVLAAADGVEAVRLPGVTEPVVRDWLDRLALADGDAAGAARQGAVRSVLWELWPTVAEPVLGALGLLDAPTDPADRPRLWWLPAGPAAFLPLHAAGRFGADGGEDGQLPGQNVLDLVVSSYTPSLRALRQARHRPPRPGGPAGVLGVAAPGQPGAPSLQLAEDEVLDVLDLVGEGTALVREQASLGAVLSGLRSHPWLHFSGHALAPPADPDRPGIGALLLGDGSRLTPQTVDSLDLPAAELAYLSGCGTARGTGALPDESVHVTAALHLAGYRDVVGTLWRVFDRPAFATARAFHEQLAADPAGGPATALDAAVRALRRDRPDRPDLWAPYLHLGP